MKVDKGSAILEFSIFFLLAMFILTLIMGVLPVWTQYQKLNYIAHGVLRDAELVGNTGNTVMDTYEYLQAETGLKTKEISFNGTQYTGDLPLPDRYVEAIILHMLYKFFGDMLPLYDREVGNLRSSTQETSKSEMKYKLGGY